MNTPSKEALDAAFDLFKHRYCFGSDNDNAAIIDRHFEPLRRDNATLAGRLTAAELERDSLVARAEQAEARVKELEATCAELVTDGNAVTLAANLAKQSARVNELAEALRELLGCPVVVDSATCPNKDVSRIDEAPDWQAVLQISCAWTRYKKLKSILARHAAGEPEAQK